MMTCLPPWRRAVRRVLAATLPRRLVFVRDPVSAKAVFLTFDDSPRSEYTPQFLDVLRDQQVTALTTVCVMDQYLVRFCRYLHPQSCLEATRQHCRCWAPRSPTLLRRTVPCN